MFLVRELAATRGGSELFRAIDLYLQRGDALRLRGPNGSGKTTFLRCLSAFDRPDKGEIFLHGRSVAGWPAWQRELAAPFVDQFPVLDLDVLCVDNLVDSLLFPKAWHWWLTPKRAARQAALRGSEHVLAALGLDKLAYRRASELSLGQRRLLTLARALRPLYSGQPRILLLDEPFAGLREHWAWVLVDLINERLKSGWSVVIAEHLAVVDQLEITHELEFPALRG